MEDDRRRKVSSIKFPGLKTICQELNPSINHTNLELICEVADYASSSGSHTGDLANFKYITSPFLPAWRGDQAGFSTLLSADFQFQTRRLISQWPSDHNQRYMLDCLALFQWTYEGVSGTTHKRTKAKNKIPDVGVFRKDVLNALQQLGREVGRECHRRGLLPTPAHPLLSLFFEILPQRLQTEEVHERLSKTGLVRAGSFSCLEPGCGKTFERLDRATLHHRAEHGKEEVSLASHGIVVNK